MTRPIAQHDGCPVQLPRSECLMVSGAIALALLGLCTTALPTLAQTPSPSEASTNLSLPATRGVFNCQGLKTSQEGQLTDPAFCQPAGAVRPGERPQIIYPHIPAIPLKLENSPSSRQWTDKQLQDLQRSIDQQQAWERHLREQWKKQQFVPNPIKPEDVKIDPKWREPQIRINPDELRVKPTVPMFKPDFLQIPR
jgi:hypothetical protein